MTTKKRYLDLFLTYVMGSRERSWSFWRAFILADLVGAVMLMLLYLIFGA
ncbi:hypothetical protein JHN55_22940 [Streptomyces sp. MBT56]|nr:MULTISPECIES: hypothetical protein [unclassified Streptomyces]MBK3559327.1 hypothetical protein [Streptomyces sp. MBT56]MBK3601050.1 hypothetical protein [Streptomyces sp. MBT54]MBK3613956.1 hypothetical protein [Streptomyces sp. MBT98]MBK6041979.1 hypothetical protein [Streptomyces sp. MBT55]